MKKYKEGNISPNEAIQYLEIIESFIEELFYSDYFDYVLATIPTHSKKLSEDWLLLENELKNTIQEIKQRNNIREDITDFKAADGQLSAMGK